MKTMRPKFLRRRRDLEDGREWLVTSERSGRTYLVTFYMHDGHRFGYCTCPAGSRDVFCRHLPYCAKADALLFAPVREIQAVAA